MATGTDHRQVGFVGQGLLSSSQWKAVRHALKLSQREFEIVQRLFDDLSEHAIASDLGLSPHTVHTYLKRLHRKLDVSNRNQLLIRVFATHLKVQNGGLLTDHPSAYESPNQATQR